MQQLPENLFAVNVVVVFAFAIDAPLHIQIGRQQRAFAARDGQHVGAHTPFFVRGYGHVRCLGGRFLNNVE